MLHSYQCLRPMQTSTWDFFQSELSVFQNPYRKQGEFARQALTFEASWIVHSNWVLIPKVFAFLFLLAEFFNREKEDTSWLVILVLRGWDWYFRGNSLFVYSRELGVVAQVVTVGTSTPPAAGTHFCFVLVPQLPPHPLCSDPSYQETTENQNVTWLSLSLEEPICCS